jgi:hypothetical protein
MELKKNKKQNKKLVTKISKEVCDAFDKLGRLIRQLIEACKESKNCVKKKNITDTRTGLRRELKKRSRAKWGQNE